MSTTKLPETDSIREMAQFWDTHSVTDFEDQLEELPRPAFSRPAGPSITVPLTTKEHIAIRNAATRLGLAESELIHRWVSEKLLTETG